MGARCRSCSRAKAPATSVKTRTTHDNRARTPKPPPKIRPYSRTAVRRMGLPVRTDHRANPGEELARKEEDQLMKTETNPTWHPAETIPKDGTRIVVRGITDTHTRKKNTYHGCRFDSGIGHFITRGGWVVFPEKWRLETSPEAIRVG